MSAPDRYADVLRKGFDEYRSFVNPLVAQRASLTGEPMRLVQACEGHLLDPQGRPLEDFHGTQAFGHRHPAIAQAIRDYLDSDAPSWFPSRVNPFAGRLARMLSERTGYDNAYFGCTGSDAVEAALKLARIATGRRTVVAFTHGYHGLSLGALAATANSWFRDGAGVSLPDVVFHPFDGYYGDDVDTVAMLRQLIDDPSSGLDLPAAVIVETVQGEGGVNVARPEWLRALRELCTEHGIVLIVDDIQIGIGRSGQFFSFEDSGIVPDMVTLSKSLSGYGFPMSLLLIKPELDVWKPAMHTGTFRGNSIAFVGAAAAIETYWADPAFEENIARRSRIVADWLDAIVARHPERLSTRGRGLLRGLVCADPAVAKAASRGAFERGLVIELAGAHDEVVKLMPALVGDDETLRSGLSILEAATEAALAETA